MIGSELLRHRSHLSDRPDLQHGVLGDLTVEFSFEQNVLGRCINSGVRSAEETQRSRTYIQGVFARLSDKLHRAFGFRMQHDLVLDHLVLRDHAEDITTGDVASHLRANEHR